LSWYKETDGTIVVCEDCAHLVHEHIGFQMGTCRRHDGKLVLLDNDLLSMCGKRTRRPGTRKRPFRNDPLRSVCVGVVQRMRKRLPDTCPMKKSACRFYNDAFQTCAASKETIERLNLPCKADGGQP